MAEGGRYCQAHKDIAEQEEAERAARFKRRNDAERGSASERGYDYKWHMFRNRYLAKPENKFCRLHYAGCTVYADFRGMD